jgi:hypothetical protein
MGRRRKTEAEHQLAGTFEKHPERAAAYKNAPKPSGPTIGDPPQCFVAIANTFSGEKLMEIWHQIVDECPPGVLTRSDRMWLELTCRSIYRIRHGSAKGGDWGRVESFLSKMAMNPSDRPKVQLGGGAAPASRNGSEEVNTFEQLAEEVAGKARPN